MCSYGCLDDLRNGVEVRDARRSAMAALIAAIVTDVAMLGWITWVAFVVGAIGGIFGIEGAHALEGRIENLDRLEALGLRVIGLTHFFDNRVGGSLHGVSHEGLTPFGRELVGEASRRRMVIDVAHASPQMVRDVLELSRRPVILSHGGFKGLCDTARNLDDELMIELCASLSGWINSNTQSRSCV